MARKFKKYRFKIESDPDSRWFFVSYKYGFFGMRLWAHLTYYKANLNRDNNSETSISSADEAMECLSKLKKSLQDEIKDQIMSEQARRRITIHKEP